MKGLILVNGYTEIPQIAYQAERLAEEFGLLETNVDVLRNNGFRFRIADGGTKIGEDYDFCVFLDKDEYVSKMLEKSGIRLFNRSDAIAVCDDKMLTYIALADNGISIPDTTPGPLFYDAESSVNDTEIGTLENRYGYPMVIKESYGSQGKNVRLIRNLEELERTLKEFCGKKYLVQEYVGNGLGEDMRVIAIGGEPIGCMIRRSESDFRSNAALGGRAECAELPKESGEIVRKVSSLLNLDYCGVDLLRDGEGRFTIVCEVNSNAFFTEFERVTGINVAGAYAKYVVSKKWCREWGSNP